MSAKPPPQENQWRATKTTLRNGSAQSVVSQLTGDYPYSIEGAFMLLGFFTSLSPVKHAFQKNLCGALKQAASVTSTLLWGKAKTISP